MTARTILTALSFCLGASVALAGPEKVVVTVNGTRISQRQFARRLMEQLKHVRSKSDFDDNSRKQLEQRTIEGMIDEELLLQEARRRKIAPTAAAINGELARLVASRGGHEKFAAQLMTMHQTKDDFRRELEREMTLRMAAYELVTKPSNPTQAEIKKYYQANLARFEQPAAVKLRQIFVRVDPKASAKQHKAAQAKARAIVEQLKKGAKFSDLEHRHAAKEPRKKGAPTKKKLATWVKAGSLLPALEKLAFSLKPGTFGGPVKMSVGYVILMVEEKRPAKKSSLAETTPQIRGLMQMHRQRKAMGELIGRLRAKAKIVRAK